MTEKLIDKEYYEHIIPNTVPAEYMLTWCENNFKSEYWYYYSSFGEVIIAFWNSENSIMFKLRWGY